jgi:hypothetical protein
MMGLEDVDLASCDSGCGLAGVDSGVSGGVQARRRSGWGFRSRNGIDGDRRIEDVSDQGQDREREFREWQHPAEP